jgi:hypothetical protein
VICSCLRLPEALDVLAIRCVEASELPTLLDASAQPVLEIDSLPPSHVDVSWIESLSERERCERAEFIEQFDDGFLSRFPLCARLSAISQFYRYKMRRDRKVH